MPLSCCQFTLSVLDQRTAPLYDFMPEKVELDTSSVVLAPMPGMLKSVTVTAGDSVSEGQEVAVLEAMKMQNSLVAAKTGKVDLRLELLWNHLIWWA